MKKVLFVCLGNICRSPTAEGIFRTLVEREGLEKQIEIDSAGTGAHHQGESADPRMIHHAGQRGYQLTSVARGLVPNDLQEFDYILTMDQQNYRNTKNLATPDQVDKIMPITQFCKKFDHTEVPDPYYGGPDGFELVIDLLEDACTHLLSQVTQDLHNES